LAANITTSMGWEGLIASSPHLFGGLMIIFIGDKPSAKNVDPNVPFVGTQSYKILLGWIWEMDVNINYVSLCNKNSNWLTAMSEFPNELDCNTRFIALGVNASKRMQELKLEHYSLPHPSPKNRTLNNKKYVKSQLLKCKRWLSK